MKKEKNKNKKKTINEKPQCSVYLLASRHVKTIKHTVVNKMFRLLRFTRMTNNSTGFPTEQAGPAAPSNTSALGPSALNQVYCCFHWVQESFPASTDVGSEHERSQIDQPCWEWSENGYLSRDNPLSRPLTRKPQLTLLMHVYLPACSVNGPTNPLSYKCHVSTVQATCCLEVSHCKSF